MSRAATNARPARITSPSKLISSHLSALMTASVPPRIVQRREDDERRCTGAPAGGGAVTDLRCRRNVPARAPGAGRVYLPLQLPGSQRSMGMDATDLACGMLRR